MTGTPEGHAPVQPHSRGRFLAAVVAGFLAFAAGGLSAGLTATLLAGAFVGAGVGMMLRRNLATGILAAAPTLIRRGSVR